VLQKSPKSKPFVVHTDKLKKCFGLTPISWLRTDKPMQEMNDHQNLKNNMRTKIVTTQTAL
jgi:hypothetical protein